MYIEIGKEYDIKDLRQADDNILMSGSEEEVKNPLMKCKRRVKNLA